MYVLIHIKHSINIIIVWLALTVKQMFCVILVENNLLPGSLVIWKN